MEGMILVFHSI